MKIPYEEIQKAYNERRGALPQARGLTAGRKKKIHARWLEHPDIEFWKSLFAKAGKSEFMLKFATFDWLMKNEENYTKTLEGNYDNDRERKSVPRSAPAPMPREREVIRTPEEEAALAKAAGEVFGGFLKRKKVGTFSGPPGKTATANAGAEEVTA